MAATPTRAERPKALRQSSLATFDRCALSARFSRDYERDWSTEPQNRGTLFHRFAAQALRHLWKHKESELTGDDALKLLTETLRQDHVDERCGICGAPAHWDPDRGPMGRVLCDEGHEHGSSFINVPHSTLRELRWIVIKFANDTVFDIENLVDVEQRMLAEVPAPDLGPGETRALTGQLDALFIVGERADHAIVLDWKTDWQLPAPAEVGFDGYFQQRFYAWLIFRNYPTVQRVTLRERYVRKSEDREADVWRHESEQIEGELAALGERYDHAFAARKFPPTPGKHCAMCPLPIQCPIFPDARGEGAVTSPEQAHKAARELVVAKQVVKRREDSLKAWSNVRGPVEISSHKGPRALGFVDRSRTSRPSKDQLEAAIAAARSGVPFRPDELYRESKVTVFTEHQPQPIPEDVDADAGLEAALEASLQAHDAARRAAAGDEPA